ncbi:uncharacterized protein LOC108050597 [Drosophila rhopaloa]|uniref:Uncharacterized protein LOC108050597 n=1 Tax=Drosophila rhopaloa TaxID=1041015 RepID=A0A6P4FCL2_DRORH|nr:uncharacterized protein LOC108050597 [Drosophila rhopaloa]
MAWVPNSRFEHDLVHMEPGFNLIQGQLAYEEKRKLEFRTSPKNPYEHLTVREQLHESAGGKGREIRHSLQMMEKIQKIAGTKPLGEHATMEDWDDTGTAEQEAVAMMRHFGMQSLGQDSLPATSKITFPQIKEHGSERFPLITNPEIFTPRGLRRPKNPPSSDCSLNDSADNSFHTAESMTSCIWLYGTGMPQVWSSPEKKSEERKRETFVNKPRVIPFNTEKSKGKRKNQRPSQKERLRQQKEDQLLKPIGLHYID